MPAWGGCLLLPAPTRVPNGNSATEEQMVVAMKTLKSYGNDVGNYLKCLEFEANQNRLPREEQARLHNAAVEALQTIGAQFNEQVRVFKSRQDDAVGLR